MQSKLLCKYTEQVCRANYYASTQNTYAEQITMQVHRASMQSKLLCKYTEHVCRANYYASTQSKYAEQITMQVHRTRMQSKLLCKYTEHVCRANYYASTQNTYADQITMQVHRTRMQIKLLCKYAEQITMQVHRASMQCKLKVDGGAPRNTHTCTCTQSVRWGYYNGCRHSITAHTCTLLRAICAQVNILMKWEKLLKFAQFFEISKKSLVERNGEGEWLPLLVIELCPPGHSPPLTAQL